MFLGVAVGGFHELSLASGCLGDMNVIVVPRRTQSVN